MLIKSRYSNFEMFMWTRYTTLRFLSYAAVVELLGYYFLRIPWAPLAVIGKAVAFIVGFINSASYERIWEARKIWGGIVNTSRTWGMKTKDMVSNRYAKTPRTEDELNAIRTRLVHRHIAWLTALRHAMRASKSWEEFRNEKSNAEWSHLLNVPEKKFTLKEELEGLIREEERDNILSKTNKQTALLYQQSKAV